MPSPSPEHERAKSPAPASREPPTGPKESTNIIDARSRSRSPRRSPPRRPKNFSGLKWKDSNKERGDNRERDSRDSRDRRDDRGGRDRDFGRRDDRDRAGGGYGRDGGRDRRNDDRGDRRRDGGRDSDRRRDDRRGGDDRRGDRDDRRRDDDRERKSRVPKEDKGPVDIEKQCGVELPNGGFCAKSLTCKSHSMGLKRAVPGRSLPFDELLTQYQEKSQAMPKAPPAAAAPVNAQAYSGEPMIMVTVNDRLGTKAQIPCLASDPVKVFKALVAAKIGRASHEIMLKRQGERPFKDHITLGDYGVSNGVQLDLELDTGD